MNPVLSSFASLSHVNCLLGHVLYRRAFAMRLVTAMCMGMIIALSQVANATSLTWDPLQTGPTTGTASGGSGTWSTTGTNWYNGTADVTGTWASTSSGDSAVFSGTSGTVTAGSGFTPTLPGITFLTSGYTLTTSANGIFLGSSGITLGAGVTGIVINVTGSGVIRLATSTLTNTDQIDFKNSVVAHGATSTITINNPSTGGTTTFALYSIASNAASGSAVLTGTGNVTLNRLTGGLSFVTPIPFSATSGTSSFTYSGSGLLTINGTGSVSGVAGNPTFSGTTSGLTVKFVATSGTVALGHDNALGATGTNGLPSGTILQLNGGTVQGASGARTIANNTLLTANSTISGTSNFTLSGTFTNSGFDSTLTNNNTGNTTISGPVFLAETGTARTMTIAGSGATFITNVIANNSVNNTLAGALIYSGSGAGMMRLSGTNTYSGGTTVTSGTLATGASSGNLGTGNITLSDTAGVVLTLQNTASIADSAILTFGNSSLINLNAAGGSETLAGLFDSTTSSTFNTPGTYTAAQLNTQFGNVSVFNSGSGETVTIASAVPEPGTWAMLLGGIGMLVSLRRLRRR